MKIGGLKATIGGLEPTIGGLEDDFPFQRLVICIYLMLIFQGVFVSSLCRSWWQTEHFSNVYIYIYMHYICICK